MIGRLEFSSNEFGNKAYELTDLLTLLQEAVGYQTIIRKSKA